MVKENTMTPAEFKKRIANGESVGRRPAADRPRQPVKKEQVEKLKEVESESIPLHEIGDDYEDATEDQLEVLMEYLLGKPSADRITELGHARGTPPLIILRSGLNESLQIGAFDVVAATEKRTGNDESMTHRDNRRIIALIGAGNFHMVSQKARERGVSNVSALRAGVAWSIATCEM